MTDVQINLVPLNEVSGRGTLRVLPSVPDLKEKITTSASSQATSTAIARLGQHMWDVKVSGGSVWVTFAASPTAAAGTTWLMDDGDRLQFTPKVDKEKCAVIDA